MAMVINWLEPFFRAKRQGDHSINRSLNWQIFSLFLCVAFSLFSESCRKEESDSQGKFRYNESDGIASLDPAMASYMSAVRATGHCFNGLVEIDSALTVVPCLAKSWKVSSDGLTFTFYLRTGILFHDDPCFGGKSRSLKSEDVKYSIERICSGRSKSTGLWVYRDKIKGADEYHSRTTLGESTSGISGIVLIDDSTVSIELTRPFAPFLSLLTMPYGFIVPKEAVDFYGDRFGVHPVGTGAFRFKSWKQDGELAFQRNPDYFKRDEKGSPLPYLSEVIVSFLRDSRTEFLKFLNDDLDIVMTIDPQFAPTVFDDEGNLRAEYKKYSLRVAAAQEIEYYGIMLDSTSDGSRGLPLWKSKLVRQAMNYAIDREKIIRYVLRGKGLPAYHGVLPPSMPGYSNEIDRYRFQPELARKLLDSAGYTQTKKGFLPEIVLQLGNNARTASVAEAVQEQWKEVGITAKLRMVDFPQHLAMVRSGKLPLWRTSWIGDYPDPENFLALFYSKYKSPVGPNTTHFNSIEVDSLFEAALDPRLTQQERYRLYTKLQHIVVDEAPWVFLYYNVLQRLVQPTVTRLTVDGSNRMVLESVRKVDG